MAIRNKVPCIIKVNPLKRVKNFLNLPTIFINGEKDQASPILHHHVRINTNEDYPDIRYSISEITLYKQTNQLTLEC